MRHRLERLRSALRRTRKIHNEHLAARGRGSAREDRQRRLFEALAPHLFGDSGYHAVRNGNCGFWRVVARTKSTAPESVSAINCCRIAEGSSETNRVKTTSQPRPRHTATTAGPEASSRSPALTVSLMVRTATRIPRASSLDSLGFDRVAIGLVH